MFPSVLHNSKFILDCKTSNHWQQCVCSLPSKLTSSVKVKTDISKKMQQLRQKRLFCFIMLHVTIYISSGVAIRTCSLPPKKFKFCSLRCILSYFQYDFLTVISDFWGLCPQTSTGALPPDPAGGLLSPRSVYPLNKILATPLYVSKKTLQFTMNCL